MIKLAALLLAFSACIPEVDLADCLDVCNADAEACFEVANALEDRDSREATRAVCFVSLGDCYSSCVREVEKQL